MATKFKSCSIDGCNKNAHWTACGARSWCQAHYSRYRLHGDPLGGRTPVGEPYQWLVETAVPFEGQECLVWPYNRGSTGYGQVLHEGRKQPAHRVVCEIVHGPAPSDIHEAAHNCGKGPEGCVNPEHLRWATPVENAHDKIIHDTHNRGSRHGISKLSEPEVIEIRELADNGMVHTEIAAKFGVSRSNVGLIASRKNWSWLN